MTIAAIGGLGLLVLAAVRFIVVPLIDRPERSPAPFLGDTARARIPLVVHHGEYGYTLPIRGDAQEREGGCAPAEPRPAAGADVTGLLSPRPREEGARLVSAPPAGHTLLPAPVTEEVMPSAPRLDANQDAWRQGLRVAGRPGQPGDNGSLGAGLAGHLSVGQAPVAAPGAGGAPPSPAPTYADHLAALRATLAGLTKPTDEEEFGPWYQPGYGYRDATGSFERIVGVT